MNEEQKGQLVISNYNYTDTRDAMYLWKRMKEAKPIDLRTLPDVQAVIIDPENNVHIYGTFLDSQQLEAAISAIDLTNRNISLMFKEGANNYADIISKYNIKHVVIDPTNISYIKETWNFLTNHQEPSRGLNLLDESYTFNTKREISSDALAVREYYATKEGEENVFLILLMLMKMN